MAKRKRRRGRPNKEEAQLTTVGSQLVSWQLPGGNRRSFEMVSADDLLTRKGWPVYREMTADDQIKAALWFKKTLICGRPFDIVPASESKEDKDVAQFIADNLREMDFKAILWEMCSAFEYGFSAGEILWEFDESGGKGPQLKLKDVKFRDPEWMFITVDTHGDIQDFVQKPPNTLGVGTNEIHIPPEKMLHYAYQRQFSNHYGVSDLRAAYRAWWSKKYVTQFWNVFLERFGAPLMKMNYPTGAGTELKNTLKSIMSNLSSKTDILVPEGVEIELIEATRSGNAAYETALNYYDVRIATAMLMPALLGMGTDVTRGADSQSRLHLRTLMKVVQYIGGELIKEVNKKIIGKIVDANFNVDKPPTMIFQDYGEFEAFEITDAIKELFVAGILDMDQEDVNYARSVLGMQIRDEDHEDEILRKDPTEQPQGAQQGNNSAEKPVSSQKTDRKTRRTRPSRRK